MKRGELAMIPYVVYEAERYRAERRERRLLGFCAVLFASLVIGCAAWLLQRFMSR